MVICICSRVTDKDIEELRHLPLEDIMLKTGAGMVCGQCMKYLMKMIEPVLDSRSK